MRGDVLPNVVVGIRNGEKREQDGNRAPVHHLSQVAGLRVITRND